VKGAVAVPELPWLVTVAVPVWAFLGTFVVSEKCPLASTEAEPSPDVVPASVNVLVALSPAAKNCPKILNGAVA
jgi:hypothetical protein